MCSQHDLASADAPHMQIMHTADPCDAFHLRQQSFDVYIRWSSLHEVLCDIHDESFGHPNHADCENERARRIHPQPLGVSISVPEPKTPRCSNRYNRNSALRVLMYGMACPIMHMQQNHAHRVHDSYRAHRIECSYIEHSENNLRVHKHVLLWLRLRIERTQVHQDWAGARTRKSSTTTVVVYIHTG